jgi:hypothetical protein
MLFLAAAPLAALCGALVFRSGSGWALLVPITVIGSALLLILVHAATGLPYPTDREGLYFVPLATLSVALLAWTLLAQPGLLRWVGRALLAFCVVFVAAFASQWHVHHFEVWWYDADTRQLFETLEQRRGSRTNIRVGVSWQLEPALNFYRETRHADWMLPVRRDGFDGDRQFYALIDNDRQEIATRALTVIYRGPVSGTVLATGR